PNPVDPNPVDPNPVDQAGENDSASGESAAQDGTQNVSRDDSSAPGEPDEENGDPPTPSRPASLEVSAVADRIRLSYLLALFLVRKRALRWISHDLRSLTVGERSGTVHRVQIPSIDRATLEEAVAEMEQLLG
ncbi:MAG: hypothetical protein OSB09_08130, partial [Planctomycetota bacterium]|nr:hypothetical protein [Planctomycetota bacterium]